MSSLPSDLDPGLLREAEAAFGVPAEIKLTQELLPWEMDLIDAVCGTTRHHDVTVFVLRGDRGAAEPASRGRGRRELALIHKPSDPDGAFWAPAGGLHPGESLAAAAMREVLEETGLVAAADRYLLRVEALFSSGRRSRPWVSHVFAARHVAGEPAPLDLREVESAAWISIADFRHRVAPILERSGWGRWQYRLRMAEFVFERLSLGGSG